MAGSDVRNRQKKGLSRVPRALFVAAVAVLAAAGSLLSPGTALASFHFAEISEILVAYDGDPDVQFVEIQMEGGQNFVASTELTIFDATGAYVSEFTLPATNLPNGADEARWIMGTADFDELVAPGAPQFVDYVIPGGMPVAGGMVCWGQPGGIAPHTNPYDYVDCIAYGTYDDVCTPPNPPMEPNCPTSPPKAPEVPSNCFHSLTRTIPATFDGNVVPNDTWADGNNDLDFEPLPPTPTNNAGTTAAMPISNDGDSDLAPDCIDPNTGVVDTDGDGCADGEELKAQQSQGGQRNNTNANDFFDVPTPAGPATGANGKLILSGASARNKAITLADVGVVLEYIPRTTASPDYTADNNGDTLADGAQLDRTPSTNPSKLWQAGPPNGAISLQDVGVALAQVGHSCVAAP